MELPNELIIRIINFCDNDTLLKLKILQEFNIFKKDIDKNIHKNSIIEWKYIQYEYIKYNLINKIFEDMKHIYILKNVPKNNLRDLHQNSIPSGFKIDYYANYRYGLKKACNDEIDIELNYNNLKNIKIEKMIIKLKKIIILLSRTKDGHIDFYKYPCIQKLVFDKWLTFYYDEWKNGYYTFSKQTEWDVFPIF